MAFFAKADAKVRTIFELPKLFRSFFSKSFFWKWQVQIPVPLFSISTHLRFSLESGCKSTALQHMLQISTTFFSYFFAYFLLSHWFSKDVVEHAKRAIIHIDNGYTLILYVCAYNILYHTLLYIHACKPKVVAMAVSTVMITLRILPQIPLFSFSIICWSLSLQMVFNSLPLFEGTPSKTEGEPIDSISNCKVPPLS